METSQDARYRNYWTEIAELVRELGGKVIGDNPQGAILAFFRDLAAKAAAYNEAAIAEWREEIASLREQVAKQTTEDFVCKARPATDPPQECDFPFCGCSRVATETMESLIECGWLGDGEARVLRAQLAAAQACLRDNLCDEHRSEHAHVCLACELETTDGALAIVKAQLAAARERIGVLREAAKAYSDLSVCYRIGKQPSSLLFKRLENAALALAAPAVSGPNTEEQR